jgi:hypothetical protein
MRNVCLPQSALCAQAKSSVPLIRFLDLLALVFRPIEKCLNYLLQLERSTVSDKLFSFNLALDPILAARFSIFSDTVPVVWERSRGKRSTMKVNCHTPSWIIQGLNFDAICVLPITIALGTIPTLKT